MAGGGVQGAVGVGEGEDVAGGVVGDDAVVVVKEVLGGRGGWSSRGVDGRA